MSFHIYQIVIILVAIFMIYQGIRNYIRGKNGQTIYKLLLRIVIWGGMGIVAMFPDTLSLLAKTLGIIDNMNAVILTGFLLIFLMIFKLLSAIERLEQNLSEVTRKDALKEIEKTPNKI
jgi:hypothetical protein